MFYKSMCIFLRLCLCLQMVFTLPSQYDDYDSTPYGKAVNRKNRVEIQVFRGANNEEEQYAPWGFIIRQPSDLAYDAKYNSDVFGDI